MVWCMGKYFTGIWYEIVEVAVSSSDLRLIKGIKDTETYIFISDPSHISLCKKDGSIDSQLEPKYRINHF